MEELHAAASALVVEVDGKQLVLDADVAAIEILMNSAMELLGQMDPEAGGFGRTLYAVTIDKHENGRLVAQAEQEGMAPSDNAALAVNYRTWARVFFRDEVMIDKTCAEILFMRDLGVSGQQSGETPDTIKQKVFSKRQRDAKLDPKAPFEKASEEEKLAVYKGMIESAKKTNPNVNGALKVTEPAPETQGGLDTTKK